MLLLRIVTLKVTPARIEPGTITTFAPLCPYGRVLRVFLSVILALPKATPSTTITKYFYSIIYSNKLCIKSFRID